MFRIDKLILFSNEGDTYIYDFEPGVNYIQGKNNSGKTVFFEFLDYMCGSSETINSKEWFKDTLSYAEMYFTYDGISYVCRRGMDPDTNFFRYSDEEWGDPIDLNEYKERLDVVFSRGVIDIALLRRFCDQDVTFRTFTMFNFLGEKGLGIITDFLERAHQIKYSTKLNSILNYIFNDNIERIKMLTNEIEEMQNEINILEKQVSKHEVNRSIVDSNLGKLGIHIRYTGKNKMDIQEQLRRIKTANENEKEKQKKKKRLLSDLESMYNRMCEQIKQYDRSLSDSDKIARENQKRYDLLCVFQKLIETNPQYEYLIAPLNSIMEELEKSISFGSYMINDHTLSQLKKRCDVLRQEILSADADFKFYSIDEKSKAIAVIEAYLENDSIPDNDELLYLKRELRKKKEELRQLQNKNDEKRIHEISERITQLYLSAQDISDIVSDDVVREGFRILYQKRGNNLQPQILDEGEKSKLVNYYVGSMARHTLMQLCGYLSFLYMITRGHLCPVIPFFVVDHISKPFDINNAKAIGRVFKRFYEDASKDEIQVFLMDDKSYEHLGLEVDYYCSLTEENKTGFNPFYSAPSSTD